MTHFLKSVSLGLTLFAAVTLAAPTVSLADCQGGKDGQKCQCKKDKSKSKSSKMKKKSGEATEKKVETSTES